MFLICYFWQNYNFLCKWQRDSAAFLFVAVVHHITILAQFDILIMCTLSYVMSVVLNVC